MKLLRYHLHYSQWHPWACLDLLAQFPNSAWGFLIPICPKEHLMYFYHHYQWPEVKIWTFIDFKFCFEIMVIKSCDDALSQAEHWECSKLCPLRTVFISYVWHVPLIMKVRVHIDIVCYNNYYYLHSWKSNAIFLFFVILGSLIKQCILFEINFSRSSPSPPPYTKLKLRKNSGYTHPTLFVGWGEGLDLCELGMPRNASVPRLLSMIIIGR